MLAFPGTYDGLGLYVYCRIELDLPKSMIVPLHIEFERLSAVVVVVVVISGELCNLNAIAAACPALVIDCARCGCSELANQHADLGCDMHLFLVHTC